MKKGKISTKFIKHFQSIDLEGLNEKAKMLERSENKYIFTLNDIQLVVKELSKSFDILDINKKQVFTYETIYFDDTNICYYEHHQKKRQRFKVRTRKYVDADLCYFEVKLKDKRGKTNKKRLVYKTINHGDITPEAYSLLYKFYKQKYKKDFKYNLSATLKMSYKRITLVAKGGNERMTIDFGLTFISEENKKIVVPENFIIIETKSENGRGIADKIFKNIKKRPISCSKFCIAKIAMKKVHKYNSFLPFLKKHLQEFIH